MPGIDLCVPDWQTFHPPILFPPWGSEVDKTESRGQETSRPCLHVMLLLCHVLLRKSVT